MFKKALQVATAFGVLLAGYAGYVVVFALVARAVSVTTPGGSITMPRLRSRTHVMARNLASQKFGDDHWTASEDLQIRLYNAERGFWMYAKSYKRSEDGRHVDFTPFAIIWVSGDGRVMKTATSDTAGIDLDQPFSLALKPGSSGNLRVIHAVLEGDVNLRDDKGTPSPADDLRIGPLTYLEYDEAKLTISSNDKIVIQDNVYWITGDGMKIKLRPREDADLPPGAPTGFNGAQTAYLFKNVHIILNDVGKSGILPGTSTPAQTKPGETTPLDLKSSGMMQVDLPKPRTTNMPGFVGPPAPEAPTIAQFSQNVEVIRGKPNRSPDQLNCDHLRLTLVPPDKPDKPATAEPAFPALDLLAINPEPTSAATVANNDPSADKGPMTDLTLKEAFATGHNVRLQSTAQGMKARCNELLYKKQLPDAPDETSLFGNATTKLIVDKVDRVLDGPDQGKVASFTTIRTIDATIFEDSRGNDFATIVSNGPGTYESRPGPGLDGKVQHIAHWNDRLVLQPIAPTDKPKPGAQAPPIHKLLTLTGSPGFTDIPSRATLDGRQKSSKIVVRLRPKTPTATTKIAASAPATNGAAPAPSAGGSFEIEQLVAFEDVYLTTPGRVLTARDDLQAIFIPQDPQVTPASGSKPATKPVTPPPAKAKTPEPVKAVEPAKPTEPEAKAVADRVWARVLLSPSPDGDSEPRPAASGGGLMGGGATSDRKARVDEVRLRGDVQIHQDPAPDKVRGTEIVGEAVDFYTQNEEGSKFVVFHHDPADPKAVASKAKLNGINADDAEMFRPLAMVDSDQMVIRGKQIGLDQKTDRAWVHGNGSLTQLAATGFLNEKGIGPPKPVVVGAKVKGKDPAAPKAQGTTPMTIYFAGDPVTGKGMEFFGREFPDYWGKKIVARAKFYKDVHAESEDAILDCSDVMTTYFDKPIKLAGAKSPVAGPVASKPTIAPATASGSAPAAEPEPKAELAFIKCVGDVVVINTKRETEEEAALRNSDNRAIVQRQRIEGNVLEYNKLTGEFWVPGEGIVHLYELDGKGGPQFGPARGSGSPGRGSIQPTAGPAPDAGIPLRRATGDPVVGRNSVRNPADLTTDRARAIGKSLKAAIKPLPPLVLTSVHFNEGMHGRFGSGKDDDPGKSRWADFFRDVEVLRARVAKPDSTLDPDKRPDDALFLTAQTLRVVSEPPDPKVLDREPNTPPRNLLRGWENAFASNYNKTIQADTITYDSLTQLFYAYGQEGRDVLIAQQDGIGQPASNSTGQTLRFNARTGESEIADPKSVAFINAATGYRPAAVKAPDDPKKKFANRRKFQSLRGSLERRAFTGQ